ncbi:MAG: methylated-DNA--[protein]-cysteine S-methyltransferase [Rhodobacteraceae bacterium]|nr:methylated-DNA--[protein]-cysteine S-methyltransferase [Paracoccaceae bacterium]
MLTRTLPTPFGTLRLTEDNNAITRVTWGTAPAEDASALLDQAAEELAAYADGRLHTFSVPLHVNGSQFQRDVCDAMRAIPFGDTCTYGDIAKALNAPAQAVGQACGANPIPVIIPCHRVMGSGGRLTGFSGQGGVETKVALLKHEGAGSFLL